VRADARRTLLAALAFSLAWGLPGPAFGAVKLRVRGTAVIEARATVAGGAVVVRGQLVDDGRRAIASERVRMRWLDHAGGAPRRLPKAKSCDLTDHVRSLRGDPRAADEDVVDSDNSGRFCLSWPDAAPSGVIELEFVGTPYFGAAAQTIPVDASRRSLSLHFSPDPQRLSLERPSHVVWVETQTEPPFGASEEVSPIQLVLSFSEPGGTPKPLGRATARPGERVELKLLTQELGDPGPGSLRVEFAGSDAVQRAERTSVVQRTARVQLTLAGQVPQADPHDGIELRVAVATARGAAPGGTVEARAGNESVGAAPVISGLARVLAVFDAPQGGEVPITLHYLPPAPWWEPGDALTVNVRVAPPSPLRRLPWVIAALLIAAWIMRGWRRPLRSEKSDDERRSLPPGRPSVEVVELGPAHSGWRGRVLDAHDGVPIPGARVQILVPAFGGDGVAATTFSDSEGRFELASVTLTEGSRLEAGGRWHATLVKPAPPAGQVSINLVTRRRALLERLVEWATQRGAPWKTEQDPTPAHIARLGRRRRAPEVVRWAEQVEEAAYGPLSPDETKEEEVRSREPRWGPEST
jgi:hypothetical protein